MEKKSRILVVDNDLAFTESLKNVLEKENYSVSIAPNREQAE